MTEITNHPNGIYGFYTPLTTVISKPERNVINDSTDYNSHASLKKHLDAEKANIEGKTNTLERPNTGFHRQYAIYPKGHCKYNGNQDAVLKSLGYTKV